MKTLEKQTLPKCDNCEKPAYYDVPTIFGQWGFLCESCYLKFGSAGSVAIGYKFVQKEPE